MSKETRPDSTPRRKQLLVTLRAFICATALTLGSSPATAVGFDITLNFLGGISSSQESIFTQAELWWEDIISGYQPGVKLTGVSIDASAEAMDGEYGILGSAGPSRIASPYSNAGYYLPTDGAMSFDSADLSRLEVSNTLFDVIAHEMAHVFGFGTLWELNGLYDEVSSPGQYTGANALAAYQAEFDSSATFVPVEQEGGGGTAGGHWDEIYRGAGLTGITDAEANDLRNELMTGWYNAPAFLSNTTRQSFVDLGYTVNSPVPVPGAFWLFLSGLVAFGFVRRRHT
ncbi:MAG: peptidase [Candidatus Sedimenticola sp. (ex Thyasira tokunagai)]